MWDAYDKHIFTYSIKQNFGNLIIAHIFVTAAAEQVLDCELASSQHTVSSETLADKPRSLDSLYVKGNTLGEGRFAVIKAATHRITGKECALKIINRAKVFGREDIVENELKIMRSVNHPNIIKLIEDFESTDEVTLVMELLQVIYVRVYVVYTCVYYIYKCVVCYMYVQ